MIKLVFGKVMVCSFRVSDAWIRFQKGWQCRIMISKHMLETFSALEKN